MVARKIPKETKLEGGWGGRRGHDDPEQTSHLRKGSCIKVPLQNWAYFILNKGSGFASVF